MGSEILQIRDSVVAELCKGCAKKAQFNLWGDLIIWGIFALMGISYLVITKWKKGKLLQSA